MIIKQKDKKDRMGMIRVGGAGGYYDSAAAAAEQARENARIRSRSLESSRAHAPLRSRSLDCAGDRSPTDLTGNEDEGEDEEDEDEGGFGQAGGGRRRRGVNGSARCVNVVFFVCTTHASDVTDIHRVYLFPSVISSLIARKSAHCPEK